MLRWLCHSCYHQEHQDIRHSEGRVQCLANITRIYAKWNAGMQCLHRVGLSLSRCAAGKPMLGTTARTRGTPATKSNPIDEVWSEIHARTVQSANNKSATAEPLQEPEQGAPCPPIQALPKQLHGSSMNTHVHFATTLGAAQCKLES